MHGVLPAAAAVASTEAIASDTDSDFAIGCDSELRDWFYDVCLAICGRKDPGYRLHLFTDWPLPSCRKFVAHDPSGRRKPPAELLRALFRSRHGEPFFNAFMADCVAPWFLEWQASRARAEAAEAKLREIQELLGRP